jgi:hypothetical protein
VTQFEGVYLPVTAEVEGKARVVPADGRLALVFERRLERFVLVADLPHPSAEALAAATSVRAVYDLRAFAPSAHAVVGLSVDGHTYFEPSSYQAIAALTAFVLLIPGALMFGLGAAALSQRGEAISEEYEAAPMQAIVIPFPRRTANAAGSVQT